MVTITSGSACALRTLSQRFAKTADNVIKASTSDLNAHQDLGRTSQRQSSVAPAIQPGALLSTEAKEDSEIDLGQEMVRLNTTETYYTANLKVLATEDELLGTVLDILA